MERAVALARAVRRGRLGLATFPLLHNPSLAHYRSQKGAPAFMYITSQDLAQICHPLYPAGLCAPGTDDVKNADSIQPGGEDFDDSSSTTPNGLSCSIWPERL